MISIVSSNDSPRSRSPCRSLLVRSEPEHELSAHAWAGVKPEGYVGRDGYLAYKDPLVQFCFARRLSTNPRFFLYFVWIMGSKRNLNTLLCDARPNSLQAPTSCRPRCGAVTSYTRIARLARHRTNVPDRRKFIDFPVA